MEKNKKNRNERENDKVDINSILGNDVNSEKSDSLLSKTGIYIHKNISVKTFRRTINLILLLAILVYAHHSNIGIDSLSPALNTLSENLKFISKIRGQG